MKKLLSNVLVILLCFPLIAQAGWFVGNASSAPGMVATGGTITTAIYGGVAYKVHTFTSSGTFQVTRGSGKVWYLVVAGGGSGGANTTSGGGGAGGMRDSGGYTYPVTVGSYTVTVGAGGATTTAINLGNVGSNSVFDTITSSGGGYGASDQVAGGPGGSGGGAGGSGSVDSNGGTGTAGQGNAGGINDWSNAAPYCSGGGGGAGAVGGAGVNPNCGAGGAGAVSNISGSNVTYAGGGGGGNSYGGTAGAGGSGGGGAGGTGTGTGGTVNTGGGGGGAGGNGNGGAGGSGVVIIRYPVGKTTGNTSSSFIPNGLVGWWTFDGNRTNWTSPTAGTTNDSSGNGNTGTLTNMVQATTPVAGKLGQGLKFDGVNDYVVATNSTSITSTQTTISAWVKFNSFALGMQNPRIIEIRDGTNSIQILREGTSGKFATKHSQFESGVTGTQWSTASLGIWYHVVAVFDSVGNTTNFYINGVTDSGSANSNIGAGNQASKIYIGSRSDLFDSTWLNGTIDDVRVYNRALGATDVKLLYNLSSSLHIASALPVISNGLIGWWTFDGPDMSGVTAYDRSGQGNNGTLTSGPTRVIGKIGQALSFNGTSNYIDLPTVSGFGSFVNNGIYSVSVWAKTNTIARQAILGDWSSGGGVESFALEFGGFGIADNHISTDLGTPGTYLDSNFVYSTNTWYHIVVTRSATTQSIYVNGILRNTRASAVVSNGINLTFGRGGDYNGIYLNGTMDDMRVYNRALTASEVKMLYQQTR